MARERSNNNALQIIFSFFLGLMVLAFIGIGVNTFYPQPMERYSDELQDLYREQERLNMKQTGKPPTPAEQAQLESIQDQIDKLSEEQEEARQTWSRNTSIILILFATIVMSISLIRSEQLRVISNGLLLGGLFTMIYGVGWMIAAGESTMRFAVIVFALAVTLALGYMKFVRGRETDELAVAGAGVATGPVSAGEAQAFASLEARLRALEDRTAAAAAALGREDERD